MRKINRLIVVGGILLLTLQACSPQRFFYYPNRILYTDPDKTGLKPELVYYPSRNGKKLCALSFKTQHSPKGTIVYFHGNFGNVTNHFPLAVFLLKHGYDVLAFDYQGYGVSEGSPAPKRLVEDGISSVHYAQEHLRKEGTGVALFGQSLGGATAIVVAAQEPLVKAVVAEAPFATHSGMARHVLKQHWYTWLLYPVLPLFVNRSQNAIRFVEQVSPKPLFLIHGDADKIVPVKMSKELFEKAREPKKLWLVRGVGHLEIRRDQKEVYEKAVADFYDAALVKGSTPG